MFTWFFIVKAVLTGIIGSSFYAWFKTTQLGIWFDKKLDALMTGVVKRCDIEVLKKQEKKIKKMPDSVLNQLNNINQQIENMNKRMVKIEEERNLEKELWHKIRANPPRKH
jgi:nitrogen fixation/metabolism regulation signal transduction histidine kinase